MNQDLIGRLTSRVEQLLKAHAELQRECRQLRQENEAWREEKQLILAEIDRLLSKLEGV